MTQAFCLSTKFLKASLKTVHNNLLEIVYMETQPCTKCTVQRTFVMIAVTILKSLVLISCVAAQCPCHSFTSTILFVKNYRINRKRKDHPAIHRHSAFHLFLVIFPCTNCSSFLSLWQPETFGLQSSRGCVPCNCNSFGSKSFDCDGNGQCYCQPGVTGKKCDRCAHGFYNFEEGGCTRM